MSNLIGTIAHGFEVTPAPQGFLKEATGTVKRVIDFPVFITVRPREEDLPEAYPLKATEFVPEPSGVPNVGDLMMGYWIRDGVVHWTPGVVDKVERNKRFLIVEKGSMETFTGRDPKNGTKPALGFR
ncbi:hypothetical protein BJX66DRAFT_337212 [Aspergillus keveii]|uniref:Uncharacterized protein n=1 Tax=Aspergillus keveii TaxID=714993 RepID=A0ABR4G879_9EURO